MKFNFAAALSLSLLSSFANANVATVSLSPTNSKRAGINIISISPNEIILDLSIDSIQLKDVKFGGKSFVQIESTALTKRFGRGTPNLPVFTKLIQVPAGMTARIETSDIDSQEINLSDFGGSNQVVPTQESVSKSARSSTFFYNKAAYAKSSFGVEPMATVEDLGLMRNVRLARVQISPFKFNPAKGTLTISHHIRATIKFEANQFVNALNSNYDANNFNQLLHGVIGAEKPLFIRSESPTYVIVSPRKFENTLQRFVAWKRQSGYQVIQAYTDTLEVGSTNTSIKAYLKNLFFNPPAGFSPQQFILFVGDVAEIPTFNGVSDDHATDFLYGEYTDDGLPDAFYGRFSASTSNDLNAIIDKTLAYEMRTLPDLSFLARATMVAGDDSGHQDWSNGQINYGVNNYFNSTNGIINKTYLQPEPSNSPHEPKIKSDISDGVGFANYTAHCSPNGWVGPSFSRSDLLGLTNTDRYGVWIGNCCQSSSYDGDSFAEDALRLAKKGAVGYIGASDYSYWDEDYWWAVGFKPIVAEPTFDGANVGVYDQLFTKTNPISKMSQIVFAGNLAVEASTSTRKAYYWEVYNVMGDPSLDVQFR